MLSAEIMQVIGETSKIATKLGYGPYQAVLQCRQPYDVSISGFEHNSDMITVSRLKSIVDNSTALTPLERTLLNELCSITKDLLNKGIEKGIVFKSYTYRFDDVMPVVARGSEIIDQLFMING